MSVTLPTSVDAWRMVPARRSFRGTVSIAAMPRLCTMLADDAGEVSYELDFGRDALGAAYLQVEARTCLSLICQRSLELFKLPLHLDSRLGLMRSEREETSLPPGYEPLLVAEDGKLNPLEVIEDELLLALPLIPVNPDSRLRDATLKIESTDVEVDPIREKNPFAILRELKN